MRHPNATLVAGNHKYATILVLWELFADITMEIIVALLLSSNLCKICLSGWI